MRGCNPEWLSQVLGQIGRSLAESACAQSQQTRTRNEPRIAGLLPCKGTAVLVWAVRRAPTEVGGRTARRRGCRITLHIIGSIPCNGQGSVPARQTLETSERELVNLDSISRIPGDRDGALGLKSIFPGAPTQRRSLRFQRSPLPAFGMCRGRRLVPRICDYSGCLQGWPRQSRRCKPRCRCHRP